MGENWAYERTAERQSKRRKAGEEQLLGYVPFHQKRKAPEHGYSDELFLQSVVSGDLYGCVLSAAGSDSCAFWQRAGLAGSPGGIAASRPCGGGGVCAADADCAGKAVHPHGISLAAGLFGRIADCHAGRALG